MLLFGIVVAYEVWEHWLLEGTFHFDFHLSSEILFFGILGPLAVFLVLNYVHNLLISQFEFQKKLETLNYNLEQLVEERTRALEQRNIELANANRELQQLDEMKSDFISLVSHELRAPLTTINGGIELILQSNHIDKKTRNTLMVIADESQRLTQFVREILDVSRLEAGKLKLSLGPIAIVPLLHRAVELYCQYPKRDIRWQIPEVLPPVWGDEIYLEKVINNIIDNATKYSPINKPIDISLQTNDNYVHITITDYGPGIPAAEQDKIFERFHRLDRGDSISTRGWGLGLYFSRMFAQAQGGNIEVQSPIREDPSYPGTAITITLPVTKDIPEDVKDTHNR